MYFIFIFNSFLNVIDDLSDYEIVNSLKHFLFMSVTLKVTGLQIVDQIFGYTGY